MVSRKFGNKVPPYRQLRVLATILVAGTGICLASLPAQATPTPNSRPSFFTSSGSSHIPRPNMRPKFGGDLLSPEDAGLYRRALADASAYRWQAAKDKAALAKDRDLAKVVEWLYLKSRTNNESFADNAAFVRQNPGWPQISAIVWKAEKQIEGTENAVFIDQWFAAYPPSSVHGKEMLAQRMRAKGDHRGADILLREAWMSGDFPADEENDFLRRHGRLINSAQHQVRLDRLLWEGKANAAERQMKRVVGTDRKVARARLALIRGEKGVDYLISLVPQSAQDTPGLVYERVRFRRKRGDKDGAIDLLLNEMKATNGLPDVALDKIWLERRILGRHLIKEKEYQKAYAITANHGLQTSTGDWADAEFLAGWLALEYLNNPTQAARHFRDLYNGVSRPLSISRAAFWLSEAADALGRKKAAGNWRIKAAQYPFTFYGQMARDEIMDQTGLRPRLLTPASAVMLTTPGAFEDQELVRIIRKLNSIGEDKLVTQFLRHLLKSAETESDFTALAGLAHSIHRPDLMVRVAREASWQNIYVPDAAYPVHAAPAYGNMQAATAYLPEEALIYAVQRQESAFQVDAKSRVGARGLMQLMPGTAKSVAKDIGLPYQLDALTKDAEYNLKLGSAYLAQMIDRFDGSFILAIAAYNAGPHRVDRWLVDYGDPRTGEISAIDWVEHIPFTETRNYVQRVTEAILPYRDRLNVPGAERSLTALITRHNYPESALARAK